MGIWRYLYILVLAVRWSPVGAHCIVSILAKWIGENIVVIESSWHERSSTICLSTRVLVEQVPARSCPTPNAPTACVSLYAYPAMPVQVRNSQERVEVMS
jgi:hypothetical protein